MVSAEREPIGGLGAVPPSGSRAEPLVGDQGGQAPLKLKTFRVSGV